MDLDSVTATRVVKSRNCFLSFFSNLTVLHVLGEWSMQILGYLLPWDVVWHGAHACLWAGWGEMEGVNGFQFHYPTVIWRKLRPQRCHPVKYFIKFPPGLDSTSWLCCQRKLFAWGLLGGVTLQQVAFLTWVPSSQWSLTTQALLTTRLARLFTWDWQNEKNQSLCSPAWFRGHPAHLNSAELVSLALGKPAGGNREPMESLRKNLKCIENESCWVLALGKPHCGFAFCPSPGLRGWQGSRSCSLFLFLWWRSSPGYAGHWT